MGFEPTTFGTTIRRSNQLNYIHRIGVQNKFKNSISQNLNFIFSNSGQLLSLHGSKLNEPAGTIYWNKICYQVILLSHYSCFEKVKIYRQYFGFAAVSADEARYIPYNQHRIYKESPYPRRDWTMGNVYVYFGAVDFLLGNRNYSITSSALPQEQNFQKDRRQRNS